jgi:hypothetical protein
MMQKRHPTGLKVTQGKTIKAARSPMSQEHSMVTLIILAFVGMFGIAGTFTSIEAKRRADRNRARSTSPRGDRPRMARATTDND